MSSLGLVNRGEESVPVAGATTGSVTGSRRSLRLSQQSFLSWRPLQPLIRHQLSSRFPARPSLAAVERKLRAAYVRRPWATTRSGLGSKPPRCGRSPDRPATADRCSPGTQETFGRRVRPACRQTGGVGDPRRALASLAAAYDEQARLSPATLATSNTCETPKPADSRTRDTSLGDAGTPHPPNSKPLACRKRSFFDTSRNTYDLVRQQPPKDRMAANHPTIIKDRNRPSGSSLGSSQPVRLLQGNDAQ
jgi:hypothetical protein